MAQSDVVKSIVNVFFMHVAMMAFARDAPINPAYHQQLTDFRQRVANGDDASQYVRFWLSNTMLCAYILVAARREQQKITVNECAAILRVIFVMFEEERIARNAPSSAARPAPAITQ